MNRPREKAKILALTVTGDDLTLPRHQTNPGDPRKAAPAAAWKGLFTFVVCSLATALINWQVAQAVLPKDDVHLMQTALPLPKRQGRHDDYDVIVPQKIHPLQLRYDVKDNSVQRIKSLPMILEKAKKPRIPMDDSDNENGDHADDDDECHVVNPHHTRVFPTCNRAHEIDGTRLSLINCGGARCALHFDDDDWQEQPGRRIVLKLQK